MPARELRFNEKAVMPRRSGVLRGVRGWIRKRRLTVFAIPFGQKHRVLNGLNAWGRISVKCS